MFKSSCKSNWTTHFNQMGTPDFQTGRAAAPFFVCFDRAGHLSICVSWSRWATQRVPYPCTVFYISINIFLFSFPSCFPMYFFLVDVCVCVCVLASQFLSRSTICLLRDSPFLSPPSHPNRHPVVGPAPNAEYNQLKNCSSSIFSFIFLPLLSKSQNDGQWPWWENIWGLSSKRRQSMKKKREPAAIEYIAIHYYLCAQLSA